jgi:KaiC/GvpD/RAD55 family RecA-like ATPase
VRDAEGRFLDRVYADGTAAVATAVEEGITTDHFADPDLGKVWSFLADYVDQHGAMPSVEDVQFETESEWEPYEPEDALARLIDLLRQARSYGLYKQAATKANKIAPRDPAAAWSIMATAHDEAATDQSAVLKPTNAHEGWVDWFDAFWAGEEVVGIPTGFPTMDYATGGLQPEQLVTIIGTPKAGKSTLMLKMAHHINIQYGRRVYFATFEMSADEQRRRLACMEAEIDYEQFLHKRLTPLEVKRMRKVLADREEVTADFIFGSDITAGSTVASLTAQIRKYDPHVVFVDGVYLMDSGVKDAHGMDSKALTTLTRDLKRMAQRIQRPVVISHQALESRYSQKAGLRTKDIGYASSFAQDSDVIFGIETTENDAERRLSIMAARAAAKRSTLLAWDWETSTMEEIEGYSEISVEDLFDEMPEEDDDADVA